MKYILLFLTLVFLAFILNVPAQESSKAAPERYGFKEVSFGISKDAFLRVLCVKYGFKQTSIAQRKSFSEMKLYEYSVSDPYCYAKHEIAGKLVEARWYFNKDGKFSEVQYRMGIDKFDNKKDALEKIGFFNKMFESKYGAPAKKNDAEVSYMSKEELTPCWVWKRPTVKIFTAFSVEDSVNIAIADIVDAR